MGPAPLKIVKIQGGLGNQLFGLAFARSLALAGTEPVALDLSAYRGDRFGHAFSTKDLADRIGGFAEADRPLLGNRLTSGLVRLSPLPIPGFHAERHWPPADGGIRKLALRSGYFDGYWQNEDYILDPETFQAGFRAFASARAKASAKRDVVIHYRTYKEENHPRFSRTPGLDYFEAALRAVEVALGPIGEVALVSDDPALALDRLKGLGWPVTPVDGGGWAGDMSLLLGARALILANSSFSWWAGFCGRADIVAYPRRGDLFHYPEPARRFVCL